MKRITLHFLAIALSVAWAPSVFAEGLEGRYRLISDGAVIDEAIERAVREMSFIKRPIARSRLKKTNPLHGTITISRRAEEIHVQFDGARAVVTPANGATIRWRRDDGETFDVASRWEAAQLSQQFKAADGERFNVFRLASDNDTLVLEVTLRSDQLPAPLSYTLAYRRAS